MSLVLGHLMRHVIVTPRAKELELLETMRELRFQEIMNTFGIFYMDISPIDLSCLQIPAKDSPILVQKFKSPLWPITASKPKISRLALVRSQLSQRYPWGDSLGIKLLRELINAEPRFFSPPQFLTEDDMRHPDSATIFRLFSTDIWKLVGSSFHGIPDGTNVVDLTSAMKVWTLESLKARCHYISLQPTFDEIEVEGKLPQTSFLGRRSHYFPNKNEITAHPCAGFLASQTSYLSTYHRALAFGGNGDHMKLNEDLDEILSQLQCLPGSSRERGRLVIWRAGNEGLQFVVNSSLYRTKRITAKSSRSQPSPRAQLTRAMLEKKLNPRL